MSPGALDPEVVRRHLAALDAAIRNLRRHSGRPASALDEPDEAWIVERGLQLCAQNALDVALHLAASLGQSAADYTDAVDALAREGVLEPGFAARFRGVAGFRNVLVHGYLGLDRRRVHEALQTGLEDFAEFARAIQRWMAGRPEPRSP